MISHFLCTVDFNLMCSFSNCYKVYLENFYRKNTTGKYAIMNNEMVRKFGYVSKSAEIEKCAANETDTIEVRRLCDTRITMHLCVSNWNSSIYNFRSWQLCSEIWIWGYNNARKFLFKKTSFFYHFQRPRCFVNATKKNAKENTFECIHFDH